MYKHISNNTQETFNIGSEFAKSLKESDIVIFEGDLGAGKTQFIKGICKAFDVNSEVTSPTFTLINIYDGYHNNSPIEIVHIDLYRVKNPRELANIGFDEYLFDTSSIKLIEWSQKAKELLENNYNYKVEILIDDQDENKRTIIVEKKM